MKNSPSRSWVGWAAIMLLGGQLGCGSAPRSGDATSADASPDSDGQAASDSDAIEVASADTTPTEPTEPPPVLPTVTDDRPTLTAYEGFEKIRLKPETDAPIIGLIRAGQSVPLKAEAPVSNIQTGHCKGDWYEVLPRGYVCTGRLSGLDRTDPRAVAAAEVLPDLSKKVPYKVGTMAVAAPFYKRIPTRAEQEKHEPGLAAHLQKIPGPTEDHGAIETSEAGRGPSQAFLAYQDSAKPKLLDDLLSAYEGRQIAWSREFDAEGRTWLVTPDMQLVPKDKVRQKPVPTLQGVELGGDMQLPIAFAWLGDIDKFTRASSGKLEPNGDTWSRHEFVPITGKQVMEHGFVYWESHDGEWVKHTDVTIIKKKDQRPTGVGPNDKWVHVRVTWGSLVAYEGDKPVFATAISPGADGITERSNGHHTALGLHHIGWKLYSADMDGVDKTKPWAVDEVPFTLYYKDSYAVHGAWWHNEFGRPKSHGCINMSPPDARWLWGWMDPKMPEGWYAVTAYYPDVPGTAVEIRQ